MMPLAVIEPIIEFDGLGESAFGMLLLLHDSAAALQGKMRLRFKDWYWLQSSSIIGQSMKTQVFRYRR